MKVLHAATELSADDKNVCLAIGFFDGVHLGHQQIIRQTVADARSEDALAAMLTFDRHPNAIVAPSRVPPLIYPLAKKLAVIESLGIDASLLIQFNKQFSEQSGEEFIRGLARNAGNLRSLCVGADFTFGHKRSGNITLLRRLGDELGFAVRGMPAVTQDGKIISSTRIREAIRLGEFDHTARMLGRPYTVAGNVVPGDQLGHKLGFPTANLDVTGLVLPPNGVYAARAMIAGKAYRAVLNIGHRPTLKSPTPEVRFEVHVLDCSGDFYDRELEVAFVSKLRDETRFASLDQLKAQIARDIAEAKNQF